VPSCCLQLLPNSFFLPLRFFQIPVGSFIRQVSQREVSQWCASKNGIQSFETSARINVNIERAFSEVARVTLAREMAADIYNDFPDQIRLNTERKKPESSCAC
jgi:Ras-related protein Rab-7A